MAIAMLPLRELHSWNVTPAEAIALQKTLAAQIECTALHKEIRLVAGADIALDESRNLGYGGVIVYRFPELTEVERRSAIVPLQFPYIPGLLAFREAPVLLAAIRQLTTMPDLFLFDGQGIAHPRRLGIASHLGLILNSPTIGCAKSRLFGVHDEPAEQQGATAPLLDGDEVIGQVLRTRGGVKPIYVSPGHKIDMESAVALTLRCCDGTRLPKPTREADRYVAQLKTTPAEANLSFNPS